MKMAGDHCGCCHILTNAAIVGIIQLLIIVMTMSSTGTILDRWRIWEETQEESEREEHMKYAFHHMMMKNGTFLDGMKGDMDKLHDSLKMEFIKLKTDVLKKNMTKLPNGSMILPYSEPESESEPDWLNEAMMEINLAQQIGICAIWIAALVVYGMAFKYYKAVFVLPNYVLQIISLVFTFLMIICLACGVAAAKKEKDPQDEMMKWMEDDGADKHNKGFLLMLLIASVIVWILQIYFVVIIHKFYKYLKETTGLIFPDLPQYHPAMPVARKSIDV